MYYGTVIIIKQADTNTKLTWKISETEPDSWKWAHASTASQFVVSEPKSIQEYGTISSKTGNESIPTEDRALYIGIQRTESENRKSFSGFSVGKHTSRVSWPAWWSFLTAKIFGVLNEYNLTEALLRMSRQLQMFLGKVCRICTFHPEERGG